MTEQDYYHTKEAATSHLTGVGLTFEGFRQWTIANHSTLRINAEYELTYPASLLREYIRENHTLNEKA